MIEKKIILDTDIGSDIDDAIALAYLLKQPECRLLGITTVSGETKKRAMNASAICKAAGKEGIPIYSGNEDPLLTPQLQPIAKQAAILDKWPHETKFPMFDTSNSCAEQSAKTQMKSLFRQLAR